MCERAPVRIQQVIVMQGQDFFIVPSFHPHDSENKLFPLDYSFIVCDGENQVSF